MEAHSSLAKCYLKIEDSEKAQYHLEQYHALAKEQKLNNFQVITILLKFLKFSKSLTLPCI